MIIKIKSFRDESKKYEVFLEEGKFSCNCPDYLFRCRKKKTHCKHIVKALEFMNPDNIIRAMAEIE